VLDLSAETLAKAQARLGERAGVVDWVVADITTWTPARRYEVWHDRATFHFMVADADRIAYLSRMGAALLSAVTRSSRLFSQRYRL
jgi:trans-aconitate methyltransferase